MVKFQQEQTKAIQNKIILNHFRRKNYKTTTKKGGEKEYIKNRGNKLLWVYQSLS